MLHETTDEKVSGTAGAAPESGALDGGAGLDQGLQPGEAASPFPLALEAPPPAAARLADARPAAEAVSPFPLAPVEAPPSVIVEAVEAPPSVIVEAAALEPASPFPLAAPEALAAEADLQTEAAGTIEVARPASGDTSLPSVHAGSSVEISLVEASQALGAATPAADPYEDVKTPPPVESGIAESAPAEAVMSHLLDRWMADGDRATEQWMADGHRVEEAPQGEDAPPPDESRDQPTRWLQSTDGRRFAPLLAGSVLASVVVVALARMYSHQTPPLERAETAITAAAHPQAAAAPTSAPRTAHLASTPAPASGPHRPQVAAQTPRRNLGSRPTANAELRICRTAIRKGQVAPDELAACRALADRTPKAAPPLLLLARATYLAGRQRDSLQLARRAAAMDPRYPDPYLLIGDVEQSAGHSRNARLAFEAYLRLAPRGRHGAEVRTVLSRL